MRFTSFTCFRSSSSSFFSVLPMLAVMAALGAGCSADPSDSTDEGTPAAEGTATAALTQTLSIQNAHVALCRDLRIKYRNVRPSASAKGNWITISEYGRPDNVQSYRFVYLPANTSNGEVAISTRGLNIFTTYEVRLYLDWEQTHSFMVAARLPFNIESTSNCLPPLLAAVDTEADAGQPIAFSASDLKVTNSNWVALAKPNQTAPNFVRFVMLPPSANVDGVIDTTGLLPGDYEVRLFEDWAGTKEYFVYDRATVTVR